MYFPFRRVAFLGPPNSGKTYFFNRYLDNAPQETHPTPTQGYDCRQSIISNHGSDIRQEFYDVSGAPSYRKHAIECIKKSQMRFVIFYDTASADSLESVTEFVRIIQEQGEVGNERVLLVRNKSDLEEAQPGLAQKIKRCFYSRPNFKFADVSCRNNIQDAVSVVEDFVNGVWGDKDFIETIKRSASLGRKLSMASASEYQAVMEFSKKIISGQKALEGYIFWKLISIHENDCFQKDLQRETQSKRLFNEYKQDINKSTANFKKSYQKATDKMKAMEEREKEMKQREKEMKQREKEMKQREKAMEEELNQLKYWLVEAHQLLQGLNIPSHLSKRRQILQSFRQFVISIDAAEGIEGQQQGDSYIQSGVRQKGERKFRNTEREEMLKMRQKYEEVLADLLPEII